MLSHISFLLLYNNWALVNSWTQSQFLGWELYGSKEDTGIVHTVNAQEMPELDSQLLEELQLSSACQYSKCFTQVIVIPTLSLKKLMFRAHLIQVQSSKQLTLAPESGFNHYPVLLAYLHTFITTMPPCHPNSKLGRRNRKGNFTTISWLACSLQEAMCFCRWVPKESKAKVQWMGADSFNWLKTLGRREFYVWDGHLQQILLG